MTRPRAKSRAEIVLSIVRTDSTFALSDSNNSDPQFWIGKCIHCNSKLFVSAAGCTDATVEHIQPLCNLGSAEDLYNLALACKRCNNRKGIDHDRRAGSGGRADEVITALQLKRKSRWRDSIVE